MSRKLYVGNLPYDTSEADLEQLFGQVGPVESVSVIRDRESVGIPSLSRSPFTTVASGCAERCTSTSPRSSASAGPVGGATGSDGGPPGASRRGNGMILALRRMVNLRVA